VLDPHSLASYWSFIATLF